MEVLGNRVVIKPDEEDKNEHGEEVSGDFKIITKTSTQVKEYRDQTTTGIVIDWGPAAWLDPMLGGKPTVNKGDHVVYAKFAGKTFKVPGDDTEYVCVNDDALQVRID